MYINLSFLIEDYENERSRIKNIIKEKEKILEDEITILLSGDLEKISSYGDKKREIASYKLELRRVEKAIEDMKKRIK